jgi:hypothetical protein
MNTEKDPLEKLRDDLNFKVFAEKKMAEDGDFWRRESDEGSGFMRDVAEAIVAVGGGDPDDS